MPWTPEQIKAIKIDPVLSRLGTEGLDALLSDEERAAMQEHLTNLAVQRRRVAVESADLSVGGS